MVTPPAVLVEIRKLQSLSPDSSVSKYSPSLEQIGHYLINYPGSLADKNIVFSLEFILTNLYVLLMKKYDQIDLQKMVLKTRSKTSRLCAVLRANVIPDEDFFQNLVLVGESLQKIDARVKRIKK